MADITAGGQVITDWTAVAQDTVVHSDILDISDDLGAYLLLQAALDTTTAHTGTLVIVEISWNTSGDEDWSELTQLEIFPAHTAASELIDDNPLAAASTTITVSDTTGFVTNGILLFIEDGALANSEIIRQTDYVTNTSISILDGTANEHANTVNIWNQAISKVLALLTKEVRRVRIVVDNTHDADGSTLNYRLMISRATDIV